MINHLKLRTRDIAISVLLWYFSSAVHARAVQFSVDSLVINSPEGHIRLEWAADQESTFELQRSLTSDFNSPTVLYRGPDRASFISGLENGTYYFRIREQNGVWSETLTVIVKHQSLLLAFMLFTIGAIVFLLTVWVVVRGAHETMSPG